MDSRKILQVPLEYIDEYPFVKIKEKYARELSLSRLFEMDDEIKDYGVTLFLNQLQSVEPYKILFPCRERLGIGEHVVFGYVMVDNSFGLSTMINSILNQDQITFRLNLIYVTNRARMLESSDVIISLHKDGCKDAVVRYLFSIVEKLSASASANGGDVWLFRTLEISDNMDFPEYRNHQSGVEPIVIIDEEKIDLKTNEIAMVNSIGNFGVLFPAVFSKVYKAFDTRDNDLFMECCQEYGTLLRSNFKLEKDNGELYLEVDKLREQNARMQCLLEKICNDINEFRLQEKGAMTKNYSNQYLEEVE